MQTVQTLMTYLALLTKSNQE